MSRGGLSTQALVAKIQKVTKERMAKEKIIALDRLRDLKNPTEPITILAIDDDETIRRVLRRLLETEGYQVITVADPPELARVIEQSPFDLILLDIGLPWINGYELAEMMRQHTELKDLPLVFLSARSEPSDIKKAFAVGASDYIKKPFDNAQLLKTISTLLKLSE